MFSNIKGIVYDFDGTIVDSVKLNEDAWIYASQKTNIKLNAEFFIYQRGVSNHDAAALLFDDPFSKESEEFINYKKEYFYSNTNKIEIFSDFLDVKEILKNKGINIWICTATGSKFMFPFLGNHNTLKEFRYKIVTRDMTTLGKPSADPLLKAFSLMNLKPSECIYVGDAYTDYLASQSAGTNFVYYQQCELLKEFNDYPYKIRNHKSILEFIEKV